MKAVIFDLDGVIVSTDNLHYKAWKKMADEEGISFDESVNHRLRGVSRMESLDIILERASKTYREEEKVALAERKNNYYVESLVHLTPKDILPGIFTLLTSLKEKDIKIAIGSSSKNAKPILKRIELYDMFDAISDGTNISRSKPDPEVFLKASEYLNVDPKECVVVEDAHSGITAAKRANMMAIAVGDAITSKEKDGTIEDLKRLF